MKKIGKFKAKKSLDIAGSKIGIGFECLDRQMWDDNDEAYRLVGELGVKHARVQTGWNRCEIDKGVLDFAWLDRIVDKLLERGIQPWFNLGYGNIHHTEATEPDAVGWAPIYSEESRQAWKHFVAELVKHFEGRIIHYEVWNEPDINPFWNNGTNVSEYMYLLKMTAPVIRENNSNAKIIGGATASGFSANGFGVLEEYLKQGMAQLVDVYSYHRYRVVPELYSVDDFRHLRAAFDAYGGEHVELWQAESGCPSQSATTQALANTPVTKEVQAKVLCRSIMTDLDMGVDYTCYFHFSDFKFYYRNGYCEVPNHFGVITYDSPPQPKPAYYALQTICSLFDANTIRAPRTKIDMAIRDMSKSPELYSFQIEILNSRKTAFVRKGYPLISWYLPEDLFPSYAGKEPYQTRDIELFIWVPGQNIEHPVVIDPLTGEVYEPESEIDPNQRQDIARQLVVHDVPLKDYPMFITDYNAVKKLIERL
jgi:hypothetical protein